MSAPGTARNTLPISAPIHSPYPIQPPWVTAPGPRAGPVPWSLVAVSEGFPYRLVSDTEPLLSHPGPLVVERWMFWMRTHPDRCYAKTLAQIVQYGVRIGYEGPVQRLIHQSHPSAAMAPHILTADIEKQLNHGRLTVLQAPPARRYICSPLGLVPKHDGGFRRIHDLSYPKKKSVNDHIPGVYGALEYTSFDEAIAAVLLIGPGAMLVKKDLSDAFRHIPVAIIDQWLLGFTWDGLFYEERFLLFGLRTALFIFDLFVKALNWILIAVLGWSIILHYLDDFFGIFRPDADYGLYNRQFD